MQPTRRGFVTTSIMAGLVAGQSPKGSFAKSQGQRIRVGQIGTQHAHASGKLQTVQKYPDVFELVGVAEADRQQREQTADSGPYRNVRWVSQVDLLADTSLDLVLVETDVTDLLSTARACLNAGKHIHLDKPAGTSLPEFKQVVELARSQQRQLQMGYMFRSNPAFEFLFQAAQAGWLGDIFEIHAVMSKQVATSDRAPLARFRGGSMFELGCHIIDAIVTLLGRPQRIEAFNLQLGNDGLYDNCLAVFEYPQATATVRSSLLEVDGGRRRQFVVCGTKGTIAIEPLEPPNLVLTLDGPRGDFIKGTQTVQLPPAAGRYDGELLALAAAIRGEKTHNFSYEHDVIVQECVLKASGMPLEP